jgi:hypothetical protein
MVTVVLTQGPMTLTVKGQALNQRRQRRAGPGPQHGIAQDPARRRPALGRVAVSNTINVAGL